jgi:hypothetical protein
MVEILRARATDTPDYRTRTKKENSLRSIKSQLPLKKLTLGFSEGWLVPTVGLVATR